MARHAVAPARYLRDQDRSRIPGAVSQDLGSAEGRGAQGLRAKRRRMIALLLRGRLHSLATAPNGGDVMLVKCNPAVAGVIALAFACCGGPNANAQGAFTISSSSFKDGERLATKMAGNNKQNPNCVGENVSPALSWSNPPAGTKSYALIMYDPEGRGG